MSKSRFLFSELSWSEYSFVIRRIRLCFCIHSVVFAYRLMRIPVPHFVALSIVCVAFNYSNKFMQSQHRAHFSWHRFQYSIQYLMNCD